MSGTAEIAARPFQVTGDSKLKADKAKSAVGGVADTVKNANNFSAACGLSHGWPSRTAFLKETLKPAWEIGEGSLSEPRRRRYQRLALAGFAAVAPLGDKQPYEGHSIIGLRNEATSVRYILLGRRMPA